MEEYTVITQGNAIYLEGKLGDEEQLDEVDRGMLVSNQIAGFCRSVCNGSMETAVCCTTLRV